jgi:hypothetical protein
MRTLLPLLAHVALALCATVDYTFDLTNAVVARKSLIAFSAASLADISSPTADGFNRAGVIVNNIFPGTLIQGKCALVKGEFAIANFFSANKDDTLRINVINHLTNPTMRRRSVPIVNFAIIDSGSEQLAVPRSTGMVFSR